MTPVNLIGVVVAFAMFYVWISMMVGAFSYCAGRINKSGCLLAGLTFFCSFVAFTVAWGPFFYVGLLLARMP